MKRKEQKKGGKGFAVFLTLYVLLAAAAIGYVLHMLWVYADEYEHSLPGYTMDSYVAELNANQWNSGVAATVAAMPHAAQSDEELNAAVKQVLAQGVSYARTANTGADSQVYAIRCGGETIGRVRLEQDSSKKDELVFARLEAGKLPWFVTGSDILPWIVAEEEYNFDRLYGSVEITVPSTWSVTLNGVPLGEEFIVENDIHFEKLEDYYGSYDGLPVLCRYRYDNAIGQPELQAFDESGTPRTVDPDGSDEQFLPSCSEEELARIDDFVRRFADRYARYTSGMGGDAATSYAVNLAAYLVPNSDLARRMIQAQDGLFWARAYSVQVLSLEINGVYSFGNGIYLVDFTDEVQVGRSTVDTSVTNARIIVVDNNGDMRVAEYNKY